MHALYLLFILHHPCTYTLQDATNLYLVMDLCRGGELFDRIKAKTRYTAADAQTSCRQMLESIEYLHKNKIAHCDLKPDNFLFVDQTEQSVIKVIDFGLAKLTKQREYYKTVTGTSFYMAPEVLRKKYTYHCDIWSFGVILFIMMFGYPPFHGNSDAEIYRKIKKGFRNEVKAGYGPWFPEAIAADASVKDLIAKCLEIDPAVRLTATEALEHKYFQNPADNTDLHEVAKNLTAFTNSCKFKEAILNAMTESLHESEIAEMKASFEALDADKSGTLSIEELKQAIQSGSSDAKMADWQQVIEMADVDGDGQLSYEELLMSAVQKKLMSKEERMWNTFSVLDADGNGKITAAEIEEILGKQTDIEGMIAEVDVDGDGMISYDEFVDMFIGGQAKVLNALNNADGN